MEGLYKTLFIVPSKEAGRVLEQIRNVLRQHGYPEEPLTRTTTAGDGDNRETYEYLFMLDFTEQTARKLGLIPGLRISNNGRR